MAAQYRPYRDEDSIDGLETTSWTDNEPGTLQIYEKTTEELPINSANRKAFWVQVALFVLTGSLGFLLGYFGPFHQSELSNNRDTIARLSSLEQADLYEDPTIKSKLLEQIDSNNILFVLKKYDSTNRRPGSDSDHEFAQYIHKAFKDYGFDQVSITNNTFKTMMPNHASVVTLLTKDDGELYTTSEGELYPHDDMRPFLPLSQAVDQVITTDQILYLNKGFKEDYETLPRLGLNLNETVGKVLVLRQPFYRAHDVVIDAQENGARAVIFFPDPGIYGKQSRLPSSVQLPDDAGRSHPLAWNNYGDLAMPNFTSLNGVGAAKLGLDKESKVNIPIVLISFKTAEKILRGLSGLQAPIEWNCFDFTLYLGPGYRDDNNQNLRNKIRIQFYNQEQQLLTKTVTGVLAGAIEPDRYIVLGSRRDSLNRGLLDSVSGSAVMLEIARVFGKLLEQGWRPRRTIIFNSFGSESLNLIGSSKWLEDHQTLLQSRAVAYINCDLVVTGNRTINIAASPLLYQVVYNATKQVENPYSHNVNNRRTIYDAWGYPEREINFSVTDLHKILDEYKEALQNGNSKSSDNENVSEDFVGHRSGFLGEYIKSASEPRPKVYTLDLQSIYSPFFLYAGIPAADVRFSGFRQSRPGNGTSISEQTRISDITLPLIGSKYDNFNAVQLIDPQLKLHVTVAQVLSEMLRDLSDSVFLPFSLIDYAVTLLDGFHNFIEDHNATLDEPDIKFETLKLKIHEFAIESVKFHHRQNLVAPKDSMQVRKFNDQMMLVERAFLDPSGFPNHWERKHIILAPNEGQERHVGFPGLVDIITILEREKAKLSPSEYALFVEVIRVHYNAVVDTISTAIKVIEDVKSI